jgi:hypothetical protein
MHLAVTYVFSASGADVFRHPGLSSGISAGLPCAESLLQHVTNDFGDCRWPHTATTGLTCASAMPPSATPEDASDPSRCAVDTAVEVCENGFAATNAPTHVTAEPAAIVVL